MAALPAGIMILSCRLLFFLIISSHESAVAASSRCYKSIICFGDSLTDTGNLFRVSDISNSPSFLRPPYGKTFFGRPTGRFSDGRIIVDFIAEALELPLVSPYFNEKGETRKEFGRGVNYAVGGATALDSFPWSVSPLRTQMGWFRQMMDPLCHKSPDYCKRNLGDSLILMGEIGGNDYYYLLRNGTSIEVIRTFVPKLVETISSAIEELIEVGAETLMVPGNFPLGCSAIFLTYFQSSNKEEYDRFGCLKYINKLYQYHNQMLENQLKHLRKIHPSTKIIYADYYNAFAIIYHSPEKFGFKRNPSACCGGGGPYNFNPSIMCGETLATCCDDSSSYINWDGGHFTEAAYRKIAQGILQGPYADPPLRAGCPLTQFWVGNNGSYQY